MLELQHSIRNKVILSSVWLGNTRNQHDHRVRKWTLSHLHMYKCANSVTTGSEDI
jgi:hypothetical protein